MRVLRGGAAAVALILTLGFGAAACSKSSTPAGPAGAADTIKIQTFKFVPATPTAKVGATITVTNLDGTEHSLTADDGSFDTGIFTSGSKTINLTKAGKVSFHCRIHNFMTGTITVS